ncbi:MAG: cytochrome c5 family protein [Woeseia sp.]|nr:cytochrome c5 family protein [Woeseia sp.]NNL54107.1 cytochrome c5 family protein [Woeseia sp.]
MSELTQSVYTAGTDEYLEAVAERLQPFGQVYLPGDTIPADEPQVAAAPSATPVAAALSGPQVYNEACVVCHGNGVGGAPMLADTANWQPRLSQGRETLNSHAINGYQGAAGYMPPKGGRLDLSDDAIRSAIDYMVSQIP